MGFPPRSEAQPAALYPFDQVLPQRSGIRWVHASGKSPEHYLPEATGAERFEDLPIDRNITIVEGQGKWK